MLVKKLEIFQVFLVCVCVGCLGYELKKRPELCFGACKCFQDELKVECDDFTSFDELDFTQTHEDTISYGHLYIKPKGPKLHLNDRLNLTGILFKQNATIELENIDGFQLIYTAHSIDRYSNLNLMIGESNIFFNETGNLTRSTLLSLFATVTFKPSCLFVESISPKVFRNTQQLTLVFNQLNHTTNMFTIRRDEEINESLVQSIDVKSVQFNDCTFDELNVSILNEYVFANIKMLKISSTLNHIENDLFAHFLRLEIFNLQLNNFRQFLTSSDNLWMQYLNLNQTKKILLLYLTDLLEDYDFPEKDLCRLKYFPYKSYLLSIVHAKKDLDCTCTLAWLMYERFIFDTDLILNTSSVYNCILMSTSDFKDFVLNTCAVKIDRCDTYWTDDVDVTPSTVDETATLSDFSGSSSSSSTQQPSITSMDTVVSSATSSLTSTSTLTSTFSSTVGTTSNDSRDNSQSIINALTISLSIVSVLFVLTLVFAIFIYNRYLTARSYKSDVSYEITTFDKHIDK